MDIKLNSHKSKPPSPCLGGNILIMSLAIFHACFIGKTQICFESS